MKPKKKKEKKKKKKKKKVKYTYHEVPSDSLISIYIALLILLKQ